MYKRIITQFICYLLKNKRYKPSRKKIFECSNKWRGLKAMQRKRNDCKKNDNKEKNKLLLFSVTKAFNNYLI